MLVKQSIKYFKTCFIISQPRFILNYTHYLRRHATPIPSPILFILLYYVIHMIRTSTHVFE